MPFFAGFEAVAGDRPVVDAGAVADRFDRILLHFGDRVREQGVEGHAAAADEWLAEGAAGQRANRGDGRRDRRSQHARSR